MSYTSRLLMRLALPLWLGFGIIGACRERSTTSAPTAESSASANARGMSAPPSAASAVPPSVSAGAPVREPGAPSAGPSVDSKQGADSKHSGEAKHRASKDTDRALEFVTRTTGGKREEDPLPWVIALHGLGDTPNNFATIFDRVEFAAHVYALQAPITYGDGYDWFGVRISGDLDKLSAAVSRAADRVAATIDELAQHPNNRGKPAVTGFSQGGVLSFALAVAHPDKLAFAAPVGGWLPPPLWPTGAPKTKTPIVAFHGEQDRVVPYDLSRAAAEHLVSRGYDLQYQSYAGLGHSMSRQLLAEWSRSLHAALEK